MHAPGKRPYIITHPRDEKQIRNQPDTARAELVPGPASEWRSTGRPGRPSAPAHPSSLTRLLARLRLRPLPSFAQPPSWSPQPPPWRRPHLDPLDHHCLRDWLAVRAPLQLSPRRRHVGCTGGANHGSCLLCHPHPDGHVVGAATAASAAQAATRWLPLPTPQGPPSREPRRSGPCPAGGGRVEGARHVHKKKAR